MWLHLSTTWHVYPKIPVFNLNYLILKWEANEIECASLHGKRMLDWAIVQARLQQAKNYLCANRHAYLYLYIINIDLNSSFANSNVNTFIFLL